MLKKIIITTVAILFLSAVAIAGYQHGNFERSKPINEWYDDIKIISVAPGINTMTFVKFSLYDNKLDPQMAYSFNGKGVMIKAFINMKFPPTYQFSTPLKMNSINYANTMVVNIPEDIAKQLKKSDTVNVIFYSNGKPIPCSVPESVLKEWKNKLK